MMRVLAYINGIWRDSTQTRSRLSPCDVHQSLFDHVLMPASAVSEAVASAEHAFQSFQHVSVLERGAMLHRTARLLEQHRDALAFQIAAEQGKLLHEAQCEVESSIRVFDFFAAEASRFEQHVLPSERSHRLIVTQRKPLGVVLLLTPFNYALAIASWKIAAALLCGNTLVWKPSGSTAHLSATLVHYVLQAGVPATAIQMLLGDPHVLGPGLLAHDKIAAISCTGHERTAQHIRQAVGSRGVRIQCELGGHNTALIDAVGNVQRIARETVRAAFGSAGQRCTATRRALVHEHILDSFLHALEHETRSFKLGHPLHHDACIGPMHSVHHVMGVEDAVQSLLTAGLVCKVGGARSRLPEHEQGAYMQPTVLFDAHRKSWLDYQEIFGPVLIVYPMRNIEEGLALLEQSPSYLSTAVYSDIASVQYQCLRSIQTGVLHLQEATAGSEAHVPFGGMQPLTGGYREKGTAAIEFYTQQQSVYWNLSFM